MSLKAKFINDAKKSNAPTGVYGADESYVQINELGPIVSDLVDGSLARFSSQPA